MADFTLSSEAEEVRRHREAIAEMLMDFFPNHTHCWKNKESALKEVDQSLGSDVKRISLVAISGTQAMGWVGGIQMYSHAVELHPMVVRRDWQGRGVGRALVARLEEEAAGLGALTVYLGTDDENFMTSLGGRPLFPDVLKQALTLENVKGHPFEFYQKCGYEVVGVFPDVNGPGKPDIWMAKRVG